MKNTQINTQSTEIYSTVKKLKPEDDASLPDYCSDIARVVRVDSTPFITSKKVYLRDGGMVCEVSGTIQFSIIYTDADDSLESYGFRTDFFDSVRAEASDVDSDTLAALVRAYTENTVCKVQSPRRVSVRCELCLDIDVSANRSFECYVSRDGSAEVLERQTSLMKTVAAKDAQFRVSEEIKLPRSCPPMEKILSVGVRLCPDDANASDGSVSFWGTAAISCIYLPEEGDGALESFYQPLELKGSVELDDASPDMPVRVILTPSSLEYEILTDSLGENRILKIEMVYTAQCLVSENCEIKLTEDIYGIGCKIEPTFEKRELRQYLGTLKESTAIKEKFPLKKGIESIEGMNAEVIFKDIHRERGEFFANCTVVLSGIGMSSGMASGISEVMETSVRLDLPSEMADYSDCLSFDICQCVGYADARLDSESMSVSFDIITVANVYNNENTSYVSSVDVSEADCDDGDMIFCYPGDGESAWTIGKRYGVRTCDISDGRVVRVK